MKSIEWLAGLLEGEGCFSKQRNTSNHCTTPLVEVVMVDLDIIEKAKSLFEDIGGRKIKIRKRYLHSGKIAYHCSVTGLPAVKIMLVVLPFMGARRSSCIHTVIAEWNPVQYKEAVEYRRTLRGIF